MGIERPAHHAFPWRRVLAVGLSMVVLVALLWMAIQQVTDTDVVPDPTQPPSTEQAATPSPPATPNVVATPQEIATPDVPADSIWPVGSFPALLEMSPDLLAGNSLPLHDIARYSDISGWMTARGIPIPVSVDDPGWNVWLRELESLALPPSLLEFGLDSVWQQTYGFDLTQVDQVLVLGQAPDLVLIVRGEFAADALIATWVSSGYQPVEVEGETIWTLSPGDSIDLSAPESRPSMGSLNNMVVLEDGTLVAAARMSRLGSVLRVVHGDDPSLAEHADVSSLLEVGSIDVLTSAYLARGTFLQVPTGSTVGPLVPIAGPGVASPIAIAEEEVTGPVMGEVAVVLAGVVPQEDDVDFLLDLVLDDQETAVQSALVIEDRLDSGRSVTGPPYSEILGPFTVTVDGDVVLIDAQLPDRTSWLDLLSRHDLGFAAWESPET